MTNEEYGMAIIMVMGQNPNKNWNDSELLKATHLTKEQLFDGLTWLQETGLIDANKEHVQ